MELGPTGIKMVVSGINFRMKRVSYKEIGHSGVGVAINADKEHINQIPPKAKVSEFNIIEPARMF